MKLQGWMVSPSPVGGKDVMSPPPTFELKGRPKLAVIHTRTICVRHTANAHWHTTYSIILYVYTARHIKDTWYCMHSYTLFTLPRAIETMPVYTGQR